MIVPSRAIMPRSSMTSGSSLWAGWGFILCRRLSRPVLRRILLPGCHRAATADHLGAVMPLPANQRAQRFGQFAHRRRVNLDDCFEPFEVLRPSELREGMQRQAAYAGEDVFAGAVSRAGANDAARRRRHSMMAVLAARARRHVFDIARRDLTAHDALVRHLKRVVQQVIGDRQGFHGCFALHRSSPRKRFAHLLDQPLIGGGLRALELLAVGPALVGRLTRALAVKAGAVALAGHVGTAGLAG